MVKLLGQIFSKGKPITEALEIGNAPAFEHGTSIKFKTRSRNFETILFEHSILENI